MADEDAERQISLASKCSRGAVQRSRAKTPADPRFIAPRCSLKMSGHINLSARNRNRGRAAQIYTWLLLFNAVIVTAAAAAVMRFFKRFLLVESKSGKRKAEITATRRKVDSTFRTQRAPCRRSPPACPSGLSLACNKCILHGVHVNDRRRFKLLRCGRPSVVCHQNALRIRNKNYVYVCVCLCVCLCVGSDCILCVPRIII